MLSPVARESTRAPEQPAHALVQPRVAWHADHVLQPFGLEPVEQLGVGEAGVEPHPQPGPREPRAEVVDEATQQPADAPGRPARARSQQRRDEELLAFVVEGHGGEQRQIAPSVVDNNSRS
jgi:hypothetical protein